MSENWIPQLRSRLKTHLPGDKAHRKMMSYDRATAAEVFRQDTTARQGAVLILLYPKGNDWHTVLIERPVYEGTHSGQIAFPGGKLEDDDPNLVFTALRESEEELGIIPDRVEVLGELTQVFIPPSRFLVQPVVGLYPEQPLFIPDAREVAEVLETPLDWLLDAGRIAEKDIFIPHYNISIRAPYYNVHGKTVWGATAMMISELVDILSNE